MDSCMSHWYVLALLTSTVCDYLYCLPLACHYEKILPKSEIYHQS